MMPTKWRYRTEWIKDVADLNRIGAEGWELVGFHNREELGDVGDGDIGTCVFKMPIGKLAKQ